MINIKTAIQNNRPLIGACVIGYCITYSLIRYAGDYQKLTAQLNKNECDVNALFGILEREGIIQNVKTN